ncbi:hypothetical protein TRFO_28085 [Tritrichomonas foetus]|uniref:Uncharacterized protein n=1 Tax=Tritrichomonas foetus TaxID=1144522 RepID=A0A1J4K0T0_9EUKA|nr:hypothetical protein TRFO_28085 [Tritrichomonas foetus]|eukprot:OHT04384.1 hypothetical protein TRFO_28085 [Tritrichomonas foetus]
MLEVRQEIQKPPKPDYYIYFVNLIRKHIPNETVEANASLILNELRFYEDFPQKFSLIMGNVFDMNDIPYVEFDHLPEDISL